MNNLLSYCGLVVMRINASDKDLPVQYSPELNVSKNCVPTKILETPKGLKKVASDSLNFKGRPPPQPN